MMIFQAWTPPGCRVSGSTVRPFTRRGFSRIRGSPTSGAPTRSSSGTWYAWASGSSSSRLGPALPGLQPRQGALRDAGRLGQAGQRDAAVSADPLQPRTDLVRGGRDRLSGRPRGRLHAGFPGMATGVVGPGIAAHSLSRHERLRRCGDRRRCRRSVGSPGAVPRPPHECRWSTPASHATRPPPTCTGSSRATASRRTTSWPSGADEVTAYGGQLIDGTVTELRADGSDGLPGPARRRTGS